MKTPYEILGVAPESDDDQIKAAYLEKVKDCPPDRDQERFQIIRDAYEAVKDAKSRINYALFHVPDADFGALLDVALTLPAPAPIQPVPFEKLLAAAFDDQALLNALHDTK
ncbi:MAG: J domain-containing protein [Gammaproteobacteria bacterium]